MFVVCEKWVETRTDCYIDPSSSSTIAALLSHLGWVAQPWVTEGSKALSLQAGSHFGILSPTDLNCQGTWLHYFLMPTCFCCFPLVYTGASLDWRLGWGSMCNIHCHYSQVHSEPWLVVPVMNQIGLFKIMLDRNTWYNIIVYQQMIIIITVRYLYFQH